MNRSWRPATTRKDWVVSHLYDYNHPLAAQLPQELTTKMQAMSTSAFAFYRGTAQLFYEDMKSAGSSFENSVTSSLWINGDLHLQNIGVIQDTDGDTVLELTDFDEGYLGSYLWDLGRQAVAIILAAQENRLGHGASQEIVRAFLDGYLNKMKKFERSHNERTYKLTDDNTKGYIKELIQKSKSKTRSGFLSKFTVVESGTRQFITTPKLQPVSLNIYNAIVLSLGSYTSSIPSHKRFSSSFYTVKDVRLKLGSGTGSLGRYRYYVLIQGASSDLLDDVILEMKQEVGSSVAIAAPGRLPSSVYDHHEGKRVALAIKAMLSHRDPLVGYTTVNGIPFMVHEKSPYAVDFDYTQLSTKPRFEEAVEFQAKALAKAHAIADKDDTLALNPSSIEQEITDRTDPNRSTFMDEMVSFAENYALQVQYDYQSFRDAYSQGAPLF